MIRSVAVIALTAFFAQSALAYDQKYFDITEVQVTEVTDNSQTHFSPYAAGNGGWDDQCSSDTGDVVFVPKLSGDGKTIGEKIGEELNPIDVITVWVDKIINLGKKIFAIVDQGRPVVNIKTEVANALPAGVRCWTDLEGWNIPNSKVYNVTYKNTYGMKVVDYSYRVTYTAGGNISGIGKYLTHVTVQPANVSVAWGFNLDSKAEIPSIINTGTRRDPVAGMQVHVAMTVKTPVKHSEITKTYFVSGDNTITERE